MEGRRRQDKPAQSQAGADRGRSAQNPTEIPTPGWRDIALRVKDKVQQDDVSMLAAGTAFYLLLGLVPGLAALISLYGLIANPQAIEQQFMALAGVIPNDARTLLEQQMTQISSRPKTAGLAIAISVIVGLWGASAAVKTLIDALNRVYHEQEKRGYIKLSIVAFGLTLAFVLLGLLSIGLIVALPPLLQHLGLGDAAKAISSALRWPLLIVVALFGFAVLYRYGPCREKPQWRWVSPGALIATLLWIASSALFSFYVGHFGNYNKTYGSLGAVIVLMMWLYISAFVVLLSAEINAETEHQTAKDSTTGRPEPLGRRGAYMADTIGEDK